MKESLNSISTTSDSMDLIVPPALTIPPYSAESPRPLLSVVIPTYEPSRYLIEALRSVLRQDLGPHDMHIAVVDDGSLTSDVRSLVREVDTNGRIELHCAMERRGLGANWNECLRLARGTIVHVLHQDDAVTDGFYRRLLPAFARRASIGMAFCRHAYVDRSGRVTRISHREKWLPGRLKGWLEQISVKQRVQCAAVLVRREVYEKLGGYRTDLCYALDWEMWARIGAHYDVWYEPRVLARYRRHEDNETTRLQNANQIGHDIVKAIETIGTHLPDAKRDRLLSAAYELFARQTLKRLESHVRHDPESPRDIDAVLEPLRIAAGRVTYPAASGRRLRMRLAQLEQA